MTRPELAGLCPASQTASCRAVFKLRRRRDNAVSCKTTDHGDGGGFGHGRRISFQRQSAAVLGLPQRQVAATRAIGRTALLPDEKIVAIDVAVEIEVGCEVALNFSSTDWG